ncbi:CoA transferase [Nannocystis pusilla]|uniref:CoA transferase n=1 Tax=Nannocystis pusilla TaxID=889268 RepID=A0A9X3EX96_9BACT|nr:CoA transferase [Nannocystis pusilla]MCY1012077.1 CoA transferase [Nannocystis pusilla]
MLFRLPCGSPIVSSDPWKSRSPARRPARARPVADPRRAQRRPAARGSRGRCDQDRTSSGDDTRRWGPPDFEGGAAYYLACNRNKRSRVLDFKRPADREVLLSLLAGADVLLENFKVGDLARHGLDYAALAPGARAWSTAASPASARPAPTPAASATTRSSRASAGS